jgi:hypothetical protein
MASPSQIAAWREVLAPEKISYFVFGKALQRTAAKRALRRMRRIAFLAGAAQFRLVGAYRTIASEIADAP